MAETEFDLMEERRLRALSGWDGLRYRELCDKLGVQPERRDLYELGEAEEIYAKAYRGLERAVSGSVKKPSNSGKRVSRRKITVDEWRSFVKYVNKRGISLDFFEDVDEKRYALKLFLGYTGLRTGKGRNFVSIDDAEANRVSAVFDNSYHQGVKVLNE